MFKRLASDALGLSDIGQIISPSDYGSVDSDDYIFSEDGEKIFFLIKSKSDEYCFTNQSFIHLDGTSAMNKKRTLKRYSYKDYIFTNVRLETAGNLDLDAEIKFRLNGLRASSSKLGISSDEKNFSIDVDKNQIELLKDLYKSLTKLGTIQKENALFLNYAQESLNLTSNTLKGNSKTEVTLDAFKAINEYAFAWNQDNYKKYSQSDFSEVFQKYLNA